MTTNARLDRLIPKYVYLRQEEFDVLKTRAKADEVSHSEVVRRALRAYLGLR